MEIKFIKGDITGQKVDAIVNAANSSLMGGGGVDGAIHRAGGPKILEECREIIKKIGRLPTGQAVITTGGNLPAKYVIHTVGPIYREDQGKSGKGRENQGQQLRSCYIESLKLAAGKGLKSVSFPSISTGASIRSRDSSRSGCGRHGSHVSSNAWKRSSARAWRLVAR